MPDEIIEPKPAIEPKIEPQVEKGAATLKEAIASAVKAVPSIAKDMEVKEVTDEKADTKTSDKTEDKKETEEGSLTPEQQKFAADLYKSLSHKDPKVQRTAFEVLAKSAGLEIRDIETKKDIKEVKKGVTELLKEGLGEFDFLADKLGPVIDKVVKDIVAENTQDIKESQARTERERQEIKVQNAIDSVFEPYKLDEKDRGTLLKEMETLMDNLVPSPKTTHEQYFKSLLRLASDNKNIKLSTSETAKITEKMNKNRTDAASRLASERGAEIREVARTNEFKSLKDAVRQAAEQAAQTVNKK